MKKRIAVVLAVCLCVMSLALTSCHSKGVNGPTDLPKDDTTDPVDVLDSENPVATITFEDGSIIEVELYAKQAPNTVKNFISLANSGFYNGLTFHRVISGFMIQGGDPDGDGTGGPGYTIKGEFNSNSFNNPIKHERGVISMARSGDPDSAGSQFFICHKDASHLDGDYAAFGKVTKGIEVVDDICTRKTDSNDKPITPVVIKTITIDTKGASYAEPETM